MQRMYLPCRFTGILRSWCNALKDISSNDCKRCLQTSVDYYKKELHGRKGSIIMRPSCFFRWELFPFSGVFDNINLQFRPSLAPSLPPSSPHSEADLTSKTKTKGKSSLEILISGNSCFFFCWFCVSYVYGELVVQIKGSLEERSLQQSLLFSLP